MYTWKQNETITAAKLNTMQNRPNNEVVGKGGISFGGVDDSALSQEAIDTWDDCAEVITTPKPLPIAEHEVGNLKFEYDQGSEEWKIRSGHSGVTGRGTFGAAGYNWICTADFPRDGKKYVWDRIDVDSYGTPTRIRSCIRTQSVMPTCLWHPGCGKVGVIWRRMATIEVDDKIACGSTNPPPWAYKITNENNAFALPIARGWGWHNTSNIRIDEGSLSDRGSSSHWSRTVAGDKGLSTMVQNIGELGGTFVYDTYYGTYQDCDRVGIGIASGIEFYDSETYRACYNSTETRPKARTAKVDIGEGKYLFIQPINQLHPWQFLVYASCHAKSAFINGPSR